MAPVTRSSFLGPFLRQWAASGWARICFPLTPESLFFCCLWRIPAPSTTGQPGCWAAYDARLLPVPNPYLGKNLPPLRTMHNFILGLLVYSLVKPLWAVAVSNQVSMLPSSLEFPLQLWVAELETCLCHTVTLHDSSAPASGSSECDTCLTLSSGLSQWWESPCVLVP